MTDPAVVRLDGAWTVRREAEPPPLPREMKVGGRVWVWGVGCEGDERAEKKDCGQGRSADQRQIHGRAEPRERKVFTYQVLFSFSFFLGVEKNKKPGTTSG
jgi:hypothetical protein